MGREVRRVPAGWQHPKHTEGRYAGQYQPLHDSCDLSARHKEWDEGARQWDLGLVRSYKEGVEWEPIPANTESRTYSEWDGRRPDYADYMPRWPDERGP